MWEPSGEQRALADAAFGALNSGDLDAFLALTAEDIEFTSMVAEAEGTTFRGHDGVRAWWHSVRGAFEDVRWDLLDIRGSGDRAVLHFRMTGTLGGARVEQTMWQAAQLRDGQLIWWAFFRSEREAFDAAGLSEKAMSEANVEIVRSIYSDPGGLTAGASGKVAPDAEFDLSEAYPDAPILRGLEAFRRFRDSGPWSGSPIRFEPERFFSVGDQRVLVFVRVAATGRESGVPVEMPVAHEFTIRDNLVVRFKVYGSREQALEAVGLRE